MLKFATENLIGFGLSEENIKRLKENKPIMIDMSKFGIPGKKCIIFYGKTEQEMQREFTEFIGAKTRYESDFDS